MDCPQNITTRTAQINLPWNLYFASFGNFDLVVKSKGFSSLDITCDEDGYLELPDNFPSNREITLKITYKWFYFIERFCLVAVNVTMPPPEETVLSLPTPAPAERGSSIIPGVGASSPDPTPNKLKRKNSTDTMDAIIGFFLLGAMLTFSIVFMLLVFICCIIPICVLLSVFIIVTLLAIVGAISSSISSINITGVPKKQNY